MAVGDVDYDRLDRLLRGSGASAGRGRRRTRAARGLEAASAHQRPRALDRGDDPGPSRRGGSERDRDGQSRPDRPQVAPAGKRLAQRAPACGPTGDRGALAGRRRRARGTPAVATDRLARPHGRRRGLNTSLRRQRPAPERRRLGRTFSPSSSTAVRGHVPIRWRSSANRTSSARVLKLELVKDPGAVRLNRATGEMELGRDLGAGMTERDQADDLDLARAEQPTIGGPPKHVQSGGDAR